MDALGKKSIIAMHFFFKEIYTSKYNYKPLICSDVHFIQKLPNGYTEKNLAI